MTSAHPPAQPAGRILPFGAMETRRAEARTKACVAQIHALEKRDLLREVSRLRRELAEARKDMGAPSSKSSLCALR